MKGVGPYFEWERSSETMTGQPPRKETAIQRTVTLDEADLAILRHLQQDCTWSMERLAQKTGLSKTSVWNRIQKLIAEKVILKQAALVDPEKVGLVETFFIAIKTRNHNATWLQTFTDIVADMPEIMEAHRMAGEVDYLLKVQVPSTRAFDQFYQMLVSRIALDDVTSSLSMEVMKRETALPL